MTGGVRPWFRRVAILVFVLAVPVAAHQVWDYVELQRLVAEIQAIIDRGEPVIERDAGFETEPWPSQHDEALAGSPYAAGAILAGRDVYRSNAQPFIEAVHASLSGAAEARPPEADTDAARQVVRSSPALELADLGSRLPFQGFPIGVEYATRAQSIAQLSMLISARTAVLSLDGDGERAVESAISALRVRRAIDEMGYYLPTGGPEVAAILSWSRPSAGMLVRLQEALETEEAPDLELGALLRRRAGVIESAWQRYYGPNPTAPDVYSLPRRSVRESLVRPLMSRRLAGVLRVWADLVEVARQPWPQHGDGVERAGRRHDVDRDYLSSRLLRPASFFLESSFAVSAFEQAMRPNRRIEDRAARTAVAVARYQRDHGGELPATLGDLLPAYMSAVPIDPYSGRSLQYRQASGAYAIYSIGYDGTDDGGANLLETYRGTVLRPQPGSDIGVRVLIGEQTRRSGN